MAWTPGSPALGFVSPDCANAPVCRGLPEYREACRGRFRGCPRLSQLPASHKCRTRSSRYRAHTIRASPGLHLRYRPLCRGKRVFAARPGRIFFALASVSCAGTQSVYALGIVTRTGGDPAEPELRPAEQDRARPLRRRGSAPPRFNPRKWRNMRTPNPVKGTKLAGQAGRLPLWALRAYERLHGLAAGFSHPVPAHSRFWVDPKSERGWQCPALLRRARCCGDRDRPRRRGL